MERLERSMRRVLFSTLGIAAAVAWIGTAAVRADDISRPPGAIDHRGYELVSKADKGNSQLHDVTVAEDGSDRVLYSIVSGTPGSPSGFSPMFLTERTSAGWVSRGFLPPRDQMIADNYVFSAVAPDLSQAIMSIYNGTGSRELSPDETVARLDTAGNQTILHFFPQYEGIFGISLIPSSDLRHADADLAEPIDPSHQPGTRNVYDLGSGTPELLSRMPGTDLAPLCGVPVGADGFPVDGFGRDDATIAQHWISTDGSRVFFQTPGDVCSDPVQLYTRDTNADTTTQISSPPVGGDPDNGVDTFIGATPSGSFVFYRTATSLDPADDVDGNSSDLDIYRWTTATGVNTCLTCGAVSANVSSTNGFDFNAVASEDGSHVYFTSPDRLGDAPGPATTGLNLYVWRLHHTQLHYIAEVNGIAYNPVNGGEATPDGRVLLFLSNQPGLDVISGGSNGGFMQLYRYDDADDSVTCVSCPPGGVPPTQDLQPSLTAELPPVRPHTRAVTDDGSMVFFETPDALVPEDVNGTGDIYEWHDGTVKLITDGVTVDAPGSSPLVVSASADGHDLYFRDSAQLTWDALDRTGKLYDARIDGGFPPPPAPPAPCSGEACQPAATGAPTLPSPGSASGGGNAGAGTLGVGAVGRAARARLAHTGRLTLSVHVDGAGTVSAIAQARLGAQVRIVGQVTRTARGAGTVRLNLRLSTAARRQLARRGRLRVVLAVRFSQAPEAKRLTLVLTLPNHRHGR